jgi:hypothetical protein
MHTYEFLDNSLTGKVQTSNMTRATDQSAGLPQHYGGCIVDDL